MNFDKHTYFMCSTDRIAIWPYALWQSDTADTKPENMYLATDQATGKLQELEKGWGEEHWVNRK
jgi:hypothetical protein